MTEKEELKVGLAIKDKLMESLRVSPFTGKYVIVLSSNEWHEIFKTDLCKKLKLIK